VLVEWKGERSQMIGTQEKAVATGKLTFK